MKLWIFAACGYALLISLAAIGLTIHDKRQAKRGASRVPERTLMLLGLVGGAPAMYVTMRVIRHKTLHRKFMWGLPAEIALQAILLGAILYLTITH